VTGRDIVSTMKLAVRSFALALALCAALAAQDFTGRWTGIADTTDEAGTKRQERQTIEIKMEDGKLTGQMGNRAGGPVLQVQTDGNKVNLYHFMTFEGGEHLRWKLELKDGSLIGTFSALHDSPKKWQYDRIGKMTLTKAPAAAAPAK
jgi:hypothetical protein